MKTLVCLVEFDNRLMLLGEAWSRRDRCNLTQCLRPKTAAPQRVLAAVAERPSGCSEVYRCIRKHQQADENKILNKFLLGGEAARVSTAESLTFDLKPFKSTTPGQASNSWSCKDQLKCPPKNFSILNTHTCVTSFRDK